MLVAETVQPSTLMALDCADFVIIDVCGHSLGIERKEIGDFLSSLWDRQENGHSRLSNQLVRMLDTYDFQMIVLEGNWKYDEVDHYVGTMRRMTRNLASVVLFKMWNIQRRGVVILPTTSKAHTAEWLRRLHDRGNEGCILPSRTKKKEMAA